MQSRTLSCREAAAVFDIRDPGAIGVGNASMIREVSRHCSLAPEDDP